jgi:hypothetical protein
MLWESKAHYRFHKSPPLVPILTHMNPVHIATSYSLKSISILSSYLCLIPKDHTTYSDKIFFFFLDSRSKDNSIEPLKPCGYCMCHLSHVYHHHHCHMYVWLQAGYGLVNGFNDHLYTQLGTTSNYSVIANLQTSQITTASAMTFPVCCLHQPFPRNGI